MFLKPSINISQIKKNLKTQVFGSKILVMKKVESTNEMAKHYLKHGEGLIILADTQTKGKGRSGRSWYSPKRLGIYFSALLRPQTDNLPTLTLMAGVACVLAIKSFFPHKKPEPFLKWPNDILINGKKLAGILCESCDEESGWFVIGIGINVNHLTTDFPDSLLGKATSLKIETGRAVDKSSLIRSLIINLDQEYSNWLLEGTPVLAKRWSDHSRMFGHSITVNRGGSIFHGTAKKIDELGRLVVLTKNGEEISFSSGEVTLDPLV